MEREGEGWGQGGGTHVVDFQPLFTKETREITFMTSSLLS